MQKKNSVIKNYIISSTKRVLVDNDKIKKAFIVSDNLLYHLPLTQNKESFCLFLLRK